jgi:hypothetical protein
MREGGVALIEVACNRADGQNTVEPEKSENSSGRVYSCFHRMSGPRLQFIKISFCSADSDTNTVVKFITFK